MKIKAKLLLGIGFLFFMIVLLTALSSIFINKLSVDTKQILVANYNTIDYCRQMLISLNNGMDKTASQNDFRNYLTKQEANITEVGEKELTEKLAADFKKLVSNPGDTLDRRRIQNDITDIMLLNMQAIKRKSKIAENTADTSILWVAIAGVICFVLAFTMLINLPGNIANPVKELTNSIKEIAAENYDERIHFEKNNEFGELAAAFNTMAQKLSEFKAGNIEKLLVEKKRIETLINNMNDPVIGLDDDNRILFMNNVALKIAGLQADVIIGKRVQDIAVQNDLIRNLVKELFDHSVAKNEQTAAPVKIYADNKQSYFEKEIIPIKIIPTGEATEKMIGNVIVLKNITSYKELDFAKTNFIATVSHELKTPISSIKMSVQLLENEQVGKLNREQGDLIESIREDANRLLKITGELLNMTQVESGSIQMNVMPNQVKDIVEYAVNTNKTAAEQKQIKIELDIPTDLPKVMADNEKTAWVLTNLLSNAIRYSYENATIFIQVSSVNDKIRFSVKDTGQGIPPQYVDKIFDRYFRIPGTKKEGTGLGLSISKEFIEAQGGQIEVVSDLGAGSTFSFTLHSL